MRIPRAGNRTWLPRPFGRHGYRIQSGIRSEWLGLLFSVIRGPGLKDVLIAGSTFPEQIRENWIDFLIFFYDRTLWSVLWNIEAHTPDGNFENESGSEWRTLSGTERTPLTTFGHTWRASGRTFNGTQGIEHRALWRPPHGASLPWTLGQPWERERVHADSTDRETELTQCSLSLSVSYPIWVTIQSTWWNQMRSQDSIFS